MNIIKTKRKLLKTGDYTYMLTFPKDWIKALRWQAKRKVELVFKKDKIIIQRISKK